jgi:CheY-like chemotaxis protein
MRHLGSATRGGSVIDGESNIRVLVVDDDEFAVQAISQILTAAGCTVCSLATAIGVTQLVLQNDIDVVLLDLQMPALRGDRLAAMLRGNRKLKDIPVVLVSAASEQELQAISARMSGVHTLSKKRVRRELVPLVQDLACKKRGASISKEACAIAEPSPPSLPSQDQKEDSQEKTPLGAALLGNLPGRLVELTKLWRETARGDQPSKVALLALLHELKGECQLLEFNAFSEVLAGVEGIAKQVAPDSPPSVSAAVLGAVNALSRKVREGSSAKSADMGVTVQRLTSELNRAFASPNTNVTGKIGDRALGAA